MPRSAIFLLLICFTFLPIAQAQTKTDSLTYKPSFSRDDWLAKDKADHFIVSAFITGCTFYAARQEAHFSSNSGKNLAVGVTITIGILKELYDGLSGKGHMSCKDLTADAIGAGLGYLLLSITYR